MKTLKTAPRGVHPLIALALTGLAIATPAQADTPTNGTEIHDFAQHILQTVQEAAAVEAVETAPKQVEPQAASVGQGEASYYGRELAGNRTASGERFNPAALTAAHRSLPLGSKLRVVNVKNGKSVVVRVNDRGPFARSRIIDVSYGAAQQIGMVRSGTAKVRLELLS